MTKYIIELEDDIKYLIINGRADNRCYTLVRPVEELEILNSDYINEHYGELQDTAYKKGLHDGESKCRYCNDYQRGLEDAWEAARKISLNCEDGGINSDGLREIFGTGNTYAIIQSNTAQEAIEKIKAYESKQKDRIEVGDIVDRYIDGKFDSRGIYLQDDGGYWRCLFDTGAVLMTFAYPKGQFKKTGKHYDIASILEAMRTHD